MTTVNTNLPTISHTHVWISIVGPNRYLCFFNHLPVTINDDQLKELMAQVEVEIIAPDQQDKIVNQLQRVSAQTWEGWEYPFSQTKADTTSQQEWLHKLNLVRAWHGIDIARHGILAEFERQLSHKIDECMSHRENLPHGKQNEALVKVLGKPEKLIVDKLKQGKISEPDLCGYPLNQVAECFDEWVEEWKEELDSKKWIAPSHLSLTELPPEIVSSCTNIELIDLEYNCLSTLPEALGSLSNLKIIELRENDIAHFPPSVANLNACTTLKIINTRSVVFPLNIELFPALETLEMCGRFAYIPSRLFQIRTLQSLFIMPACIGQCVEISEDLGNLNRLERLTIFHPKNLPESVGNLRSIKKLKFTRGSIREVPKTLQNLSQLEELDLDRNPISELPDWLKKMGPKLRVYLTTKDIKKQLLGKG